MAVTVIFAGAADSDLLSTHASDIDAAFNGTGALSTPVNSANELWIGQFFFGSYSAYESFVDFDLSAINPGQTCTSAVMQTYLITDGSTSNDFYGIALLYDWGATVTTADWQDCAEQVALGAWWTTINTNGIGATGAYKSWSDTTDIQALCTLLAGSEINFCLSTDLQRSAVDGGTAYLTWSSTNVGGTTQDPKLTVTHSERLIDHTMSVGFEMGVESDVTTVPLANVTTDGAGILGVESDVTVIHGPSVLSDLLVEVEIDGAWVEVTERVMAAETFSGRSSAALVDFAAGGKLQLTCINDDDVWYLGDTTSPLYGLKTGSRVRVRTQDAVPADPVLLVRDRFNRDDDPTGLGVAETGQTWTIRAGGFDVLDSVAAANDVPSTHLIHTIDCGEVDHYVQATVLQLPTVNRRIGMILRWDDNSNYVYGYVDSNPTLGLRIVNVAAGVSTTVDSYAVQPFEGMTIGFSIVGTTAKGYIGGVEVLSGTAAAASTSTDVGLYAFFTQLSGRPPELDDFHCWDSFVAEVDGILWTGFIDDVEPRVRPGPEKVATVTGFGALTVAANPVIAAPRLPRAGMSTGLLVGECMARASMLNPPQPSALDVGAVTTGCVAIDDGKALDLARKFETVERGFIYETNEGQVGFTDSTRRATATSQATFTDLPGGQFGYTELVPLDERASIINKTTGQVAPDPPTDVGWGTLLSTNQTVRGGGSGNAVDVLMPATVAVDDLLVVFISSSVDDGHDWLTPIWWTSHRDLKAAAGLRVYSHFCDGTEGGTTVSFYDNAGGASGLWVAWIFRIEDWYEATAGVAISAFGPNTDTPPVLHGWGREPTLFIVAQGAIGSSAGSSVSAFAAPPDGYYGSNGTRSSSGVFQYDVGLSVASKVDAAEVEQASPFDKLLNFTTTEICTVAVRGYNGPHTKATLDNPRTTGGDGRFVEVEDVDSQDEHGGIQDVETARLFADETDALAFGLLTVAQLADDRATLQVSYIATKSGNYRNLAIRLRVGDKVTLVAENNAGLGVNGDYFIENVSHRFSNGGTLWEVTYECSPA
jgi:hypothetical protein